MKSSRKKRIVISVHYFRIIFFLEAYLIVKEFEYFMQNLNSNKSICDKCDRI